MHIVGCHDFHARYIFQLDKFRRHFANHWFQPEWSSIRDGRCFNKKYNSFWTFSIISTKKNPFSYLTQWAAVTIHESLITEQPQLWSPKYFNEHWKGATPSGASLPPTMRDDDDCGGYAKILNANLSFFLSFSIKTNHSITYQIR